MTGSTSFWGATLQIAGAVVLGLLLSAASVRAEEFIWAEYGPPANGFDYWSYNIPGTGTITQPFYGILPEVPLMTDVVYPDTNVPGQSVSFQLAEPLTVTAGAFTDVLASFRIDDDLPANAVNTQFALPAEAGAVFMIVYYARDVGIIAVLDVDPDTGVIDFDGQTELLAYEVNGLKTQPVDASQSERIALPPYEPAAQEGDFWEYVGRELDGTYTEPFQEPAEADDEQFTDVFKGFPSEPNIVEITRRATEPVTVPAGTFTDVLVIYVFDIDAPANELNTQFDVPTVAGALTDIIYLARGVGLIKVTGISAFTGEFEPGEDVELVAYSVGDLSSGPPPQEPVEVPVSEAGARVACGLIDTPVRDNGANGASCSAFVGQSRASADLASASVKVFADNDQGLDVGNIPDLIDSKGTVVDLITITRGFNGAGQAAGTFEIDIDGLMDNGDPSFESEARFLALIWYPDEAAPDCIETSNDCLQLVERGYDFAEVYIDLLAGSSTVETEVVTGGGGSGTVASNNANDIRATLSVPWRVTEDAPSFYVAVYGVASVTPDVGGTADFFNTAKARFTGPPGYGYSGKQGFRSAETDDPAVEQPTDPVRLSGSIVNIDGREVNAMVLASGQYLFSNRPVGRYDLGSLPREPDGGVRRQIYANGFVPKVEVVRGSTAEPVVLDSTGQCPDYNGPSAPAARPESRGQRHSISGNVVVGNTDTPVRAMVLVNGQYTFADAQGEFELVFPLDANGQYTRQVYASGFAPAIQLYDASNTGGVVRLARSSECQ